MSEDIFFEKDKYSYSHASMIPSFNDFKLHTHMGYEVYIYLDGDAEYIIESKTFPMTPYDIFVTKTDELHQVKHISKAKYERIVIQFGDDFLEENNCIAYQKVLKHRNRDTDTDNMISPTSSEKKKIIDCVSRIEKYIADAELFSDTIVKCTIIELLHIINTIKSDKVKVKKNNNIGSIIDYISKNLSTDIKLDDIAKYMFMSKYHICRIFKNYTGITINKYITGMRIKYVQKLYSEGHSLSSACEIAGFSSYSNFYKAYYNETGKSPKKDIENYNLFNDIELQE